MPKALIISPYFPPSNAADMQRVRMSLAYYQKFNWKVEIVCVDESFVDISKDPLLLKSVPSEIIIHKVSALSKKWTSKIGLGSIALRSLYYYYTYVNTLLKQSKFDLIYFSTTQFPVCILGTYWKKKFKIPYVIDMQDPWHTDYYENKPKSERPPKYWFSYNLNKFLEPIAMRNVDGLISVSENYITTLIERYPKIKGIPTTVIPFGADPKDYLIAQKFISEAPIKFNKAKINIFYIGAVGKIMHQSLHFLFSTLSLLKQESPERYNEFQFYFLGTSYAAQGQGKKSVAPLAEELNISDIVTEQTDRLPYFATLKLITCADAILILGSDEENYNPSKILTYSLSNKKILGLFKSNSKASHFVKDLPCKTINYDLEKAQLKLLSFLKEDFKNTESKSNTNNPIPLELMAEALTKAQCSLFDSVLSMKKQNL